jgi:hypothetical protein
MDLWARFRRTLAIAGADPFCILTAMDFELSGRRMIRIHRLAAVAALAAAAACGPGRPAPVPARWVVLREDAEQRVSLNVLSIRTEHDDIRTATVAIVYGSVQESVYGPVQERDSVRYDHEEITLRFDCRRGAMRRDGGAQYLGEEIAAAWMAGPPPTSVEGKDVGEWDKVPPDTYPDDAMKLVCRPEL